MVVAEVGERQRQRLVRGTSTTYASARLRRRSRRRLLCTSTIVSRRDLDPRTCYPRWSQRAGLRTSVAITSTRVPGRTSVGAATIRPTLEPSALRGSARGGAIWHAGSTIVDGLGIGDLTALNNDHEPDTAFPRFDRVDATARERGSTYITEHPGGNSPDLGRGEFTRGARRTDTSGGRG